MNPQIKQRIEQIRNGEVPEGYLDRKSGIVPNEWQIVKLKEIGSFRKGKNISTKDTTDVGLPAMMYGDIYVKYNTHFDSVDYRIGKETANKSTPISTGALLFTCSGETAEEIGKCVCYLGNETVFIGGDILALTVKKHDSLFLAYQQNGYGQTRHKASMGQGYSVVHIYEKHLSTLNIPIPPLPEQQKIANILSTWDKAIALQEKLIVQKKELKRGLMQRLLTGKVRLPGFDGEWEEVRLGDIFKRTTRKNSISNTNVLTISAQQGLINQENYFKKSVASAVLDNYYLLKKGEFAYNKSYSNGYPMGAIKRLNIYDIGIVTTLYICFSIINNSTTDSDFFEQYFESGLLNKKIKQIAHEGGRAHGLLNVAPKDFFDVKYYVPLYIEQKTIGKILVKADKEIKLLELKLDALKEQKKGLMQLLLTGIVRVKV